MISFFVLLCVHVIVFPVFSLQIFRIMFVIVYVEKINFLNLKISQISTSPAEIRTKMNLKQAMTSLQGMAEFYFFSLSSLLPELGSLC